MNTIILEARVQTQVFRLSAMHIGNLSTVIVCALCLSFAMPSPVLGGEETAERLKREALALMDQGRPKEAAAAFLEALKSEISPGRSMRCKRRSICGRAMRESTAILR